MGAPKVPDQRLRDAVALVEIQLRAGVPQYVNSGNGAAKIAGQEAVRLGWFINADQMFTWLRRAKERLDIEPDWNLYEPARYTQPVARFQLVEAPPPRIIQPSDEEIETVLFIGDRHRDPRHPHRIECDTWIARFGSERRPRHVVDAGDALTMDSVSRHDKNDTLRGRQKPAIKDDLEHHEEMHRSFERGRDPDWKPLRKKSRGNHEHRLFLFENEHPESEGTHTHAYAQTLLQFGWREYDYGQIFYIGGVGFTHAPFSGMGKPMGGVTMGQRAGALLTSSLVHGHTHKRSVYDAPKLGHTEAVTVISGGCALPQGEIEHYASVTPTGWWWGVVLMECQAGQVLNMEWRTMDWLRRRYSDDGADVRAA